MPSSNSLSTRHTHGTHRSIHADKILIHIKFFLFNSEGTGEMAQRVRVHTFLPENQRMELVPSTYVRQFITSYED